MELGIDSFAAISPDENGRWSDPQRSLHDLLARIEGADAAGLGIFGIGEHHRREYLDSAPPVILAAGAARTHNIRLTSAVTVLSAADPVRVFQSYATLDLISGGRAEMVVGRGSFSESFPLFGLDFDDYDALFNEKLDLLLKIRAGENITWKGRFRPPLNGQGIYPRPVQNPLPIWIGVGGTPASFERAGRLGLPLMVAIIGGHTHRFAPLVQLYREAGARAGHAPDKLKVGLHSLGYVAETSEQARAEYFPGYAKTFTQIGLERGWSAVTRAQFDDLTGPRGALLVGSPAEVAEKIARHSEALGGLARVTFQMDAGLLRQAQFMESIALLGTRVAPLLV